jgi:hypothetical protein
VRLHQSLNRTIRYNLIPKSLAPLFSNLLPAFLTTALNRTADAGNIAPSVTAPFRQAQKVKLVAALSGRTTG